MTTTPFDIQQLATRPWVRALIVIVTLLLSAAIAFYQQPSIVLAVVAVPVAFIGYILLTRFPTLGPFAIVIAAPLVGFEIALTATSGINVSMMLLSATLAVWVLDMVIVQKRLAIHPERVFVPLLGLVLVATLSFITGQLQWYPIEGAPVTGQLAGLGLFFMTAGAFLVAAHRIGSRRGLQVMVWTFTALCAIYLSSRAVPFLGFIDEIAFIRNSTGSVFWIWLLALPLGQALFNTDLKPVWRVLLGAMSLLAMYVALGLAITWASGWVPMLAVVGVLLAFKSPRLLIPAGLIVVLVFAMNAQTLINEFWLGLSHEHYSANTRVAAWRVVLEIAGKNPIWGLGPSNYYYYTPLYTLLGYRVQFNSHSQYVDLIAQVGIVGLVLFVWFMAEIGRLGIQLSRTVRTGFERAYAYSAVAGVVGMLVAGFLGDWLIPFIYNITLGGFRASVVGWVFLGALVAMKYNYADGAKE